MGGDEEEISVTEEALVTMSAGRDSLSCDASDEASDVSVPEAADVSAVSTATCKRRGNWLSPECIFWRIY